MSSKGSEEPKLPDVGITALVPDRWGGPWESRHQILTRLSRWFNVVWVDPVCGPREVHKRLLEHRRELLHNDAVPPGFQTYRRSYLFPQFFKPWLGKQSERGRLAYSRYLLRRRGARRHVLYLWRDRFGSALDQNGFDLSCYHIDDEYTFKAEEVPISAREDKVINGADFVVVTSLGLLRRKGGINPDTVRIPNGVDYDAFAVQPLEGAAVVPEDLQSIPGPLIGYVGIVKPHLDVELLTRLAELRPDYSFVFVGPWRNLNEETFHWKRLAEMQNVHMVGEKHFSLLPQYVNSLDVCMLCYKKNTYTDQIYPLKLHEYFASGKPVIGTPLESFEEFKEYIYLAKTPDDWAEAVDSALRGQDAIKVAARREIARAHDWNVLAYRLAAKICEHLGPEYTDRLEKAGESQNA